MTAKTLFVRAIAAIFNSSDTGAVEKDKLETNDVDISSIDFTRIDPTTVNPDVHPDAWKSLGLETKDQ